jgi:heme/copper-type cytochrome/quinol oxidase subunit 3
LIGKQKQQLSRARNYEKRLTRFFRPYSIVLNFYISGLAVIFAGLLLAFYLAEKSSEAVFNQYYIFIFAGLLVSIANVYSFLILKRKFNEQIRTGFNQFVSIVLSLAIIALIVHGFELYKIIQWIDKYPTDIQMGYFSTIKGFQIILMATGMVFMGWYFLKALRFTKTQGLDIYYFTDFRNKLTIGLIGKYWTFINIVWICICLIIVLIKIYLSNPDVR